MIQYTKEMSNNSKIRNEIGVTRMVKFRQATMYKDIRLVQQRQECGMAL